PVGDGRRGLGGRLRVLRRFLRGGAVLRGTAAGADGSGPDRARARRPEPRLGLDGPLPVLRGDLGLPGRGRRGVQPRALGPGTILRKTDPPARKRARSLRGGRRRFDRFEEGDARGGVVLARKGAARAVRRGFGARSALRVGGGAGLLRRARLPG